jgi:hypothetical protein
MLKLSNEPNFEYDGEKITANGYREIADNTLYHEYKQPEQKGVKLTFVPYYTWGNRGENEMSVYIRI